ncbi:MAG: hypothetical protein HXY20_04680 [Acidobacteria bacterium]|nr:hypothetical protein [Acidobacteriota bacterium]
MPTESNPKHSHALNNLLFTQKRRGEDPSDVWERAVTSYEFIRGGISSYPYLEYYRALLRVRGAESGFRFSEAFDIDSTGKKQVYGLLP